MEGGAKVCQQALAAVDVSLLALVDHEIELREGLYCIFETGTKKGCVRRANVRVLMALESKQLSTSLWHVGQSCI